MNLRLARYVDRWVGLAICFVLWLVARARGALTGRHTVPPLLATTPDDPADRAAPPRRVLAIKFYGLGNIAMILPTLQALRQGDPNTRVDFLTLPGNVSLLRRSGLVGDVLTVEVSSFGAFLRSALGLASGLRRARYDTVLDFEQFMKLSGILAFWTGAASRVGFNTEGQARGWLYTHRVAYADTDHMADIFMRTALPSSRAILPAPRVRLAVDVAERADILAKLGIGADEPVVAMHVGTGPNYDKIALKRWDVDRFAAVADELVSRLGARIVFTGVGAEEASLVDEALGVMRHPERALSACDRLSVVELLALLDASRFVVSNDTSVMHLTGLVDTPVVAFFGATEPRLYGPRGDHDLVFYKSLFCSPCLSNYNLKMSRCVNPVCMRAITVDEVLRGIAARFPEIADAAAPRAASL
ncbi:glycosyltransferase family 9 protein [Candidatus Binatia bacterium]|nr:glycosyltransferase family 9 protein [Candidatus Binatia bacterium]